MFNAIMALAAGGLFGFLIQRSEVHRYDRQLSALLMEDMTAVKFFLSAVAAAMAGFHVLSSFGLVSFSVSSAVLGADLFGGLVFGLGWALSGCGPATAAGALGEGRADALAGILGMVLGSVLFAELYPFTKLSVFSWGNLGHVTFPGYTGTKPLPWVLCFLVIAAGLAFLFERNDL